LSSVQSRFEDGGPAQGHARVIAMLAHDIRTALGGVLGGVALIDQSAADPAMRAQLERISASADLLVPLIDNALDLAAIGSFDHPGAGEPVEVTRFLRDMSRMWAAEAERKGVRLSLAIEARAPETVPVDHTRLSRVIGNLVGNAVKFTDRGAITLRADADREGRAVFEVEDTGPGIPEALGTELFEPYRRASGTGKPGTGLGLYIAKTLIEQVGGTISLSSRPGGGGAVARVTLPAAADPQAAVEPATPAAAGPATPAAAGPATPAAAGPATLVASGPANAPATPPAAGPDAGVTPEDAAAWVPPVLPDLSRFHILMAEDNVTNQLVAGQMLRSMNARVTIASDGAEALELLDRERFDLLLVDIEMPRVSGLDVIRRVRAYGDARADLPVVALTAYAMREHREKIAAAGADGLIAKPLLGIREFGEEILAFHARRRGAAAVAEGAAPGAADGIVDPRIYDALAAAIGPAGMAELLARVEEDLVAVGTGIAEGVATGDTALIRAKTHILVSVAGAVGSTGVQRLAEALNRAAQRGAREEMAALGHEVEAGIRALVAHVAERRRSV
jgi:CheY-like chemotaxis protein